MRCCADLIKFLLFLANFICFLCFAFLLAGTIYILINGENTFIGQHIEPNLSQSDPTNATYFSFIIILLVVFSFLCIFTCLGCCGAAYKSGCMLGSFIVILFVLFGGSVGAVVFLHTQYGWQAVLQVLDQEMTRSVFKYRPENKLTTQFWDWIQPTFSCWAWLKRMGGRSGKMWRAIPKKIGEFPRLAAGLMRLSVCTSQTRRMPSSTLAVLPRWCSMSRFCSMESPLSCSSASCLHSSLQPP